MKKLVITMLAVLGLASQGVAGEPTFELPSVQVPQIKVFDTEGQLDLGGSYRRGGNADWGWHARANYFFNEHVGFGLEYAYLGTPDPRYSTGLNLYVRLPVEEFRFAPYLLLGGGYSFGDVDDLYYQAGGGIDWRITHNWGVYIEGVSQWTHGQENDLMGRVGARFSF